MIFKSLPFYFLLLLLPIIIHAQGTVTDSGKTPGQFVVTKNDGTEYIGEILSDDGR